MEVETKIISLLDMITITALILTLIVSVLSIIAFFMKIKWGVLFPRLRFKAKLKKYKKIRFNGEEEKKKAREIVLLLLKARKRFEFKDFVFDVDPTGHGNISIKMLYKIHLTPPGKTLHQLFLISKINNPNEAYYSEGYPEAQKVKNNIKVLGDLISVI
ncbi:MAG: hypothetical protein E3J90_08885 [Promethearchaeota archaeon]|nr:MAG: hypothetical protein E3J90_08885 [Candidatus Lokiarchaeota archaeon]